MRRPRGAGKGDLRERAVFDLFGSGGFWILPETDRRMGVRFCAVECRPFERSTDHSGSSAAVRFDRAAADLRTAAVHLRTALFYCLPPHAANSSGVLL